MTELPRYLPAVADAIDSGDLESVRTTFARHPEQLEVYTPFAGGTWLHYAARESTLTMVKLLVELGFEIDRGDRWEGATALTRAAIGGHYDIAEYLLDLGATMDVSSSARNPLFSSILGGSKEIARLLLERGIDSRMRYNNKTWTNMDAVAFAMMQGQREIAHQIGLWNGGGDEASSQAAMIEGLRIARENTIPSGHCPDCS